MQHSFDPAAKAKAEAANAPPEQFGAAHSALFYAGEPQEAGANGKTWYARGQNFIVAYSDAQPGAAFRRTGQVDEYCVIAPDKDTLVEIETAAERKFVDGYSIVFIPPGDSVVHARGGGRIVHVFSAQSADLAAKCSNAAGYSNRQPFLPPYTPWPEPLGGYRVRAYSLDIPPNPDRLGRIFVCTTLMINYTNPRKRSNGMLAPHSHDDFEQGSLVLDGGFTHHLRWPWTRHKASWREDEHDVCLAPSLSVFPPRVIHTSEAMQDHNQLIDVFSPPRQDYYERGFVINAADYRMPPDA